MQWNEINGEMAADVAPFIGQYQYTHRTLVASFYSDGYKIVAASLILLRTLE